MITIRKVVILMVLIQSMMALSDINDAIGMDFKQITDNDKSTFEIRRILTTSSAYDGSCYELRKDSKLNKFCYPDIIIPGEPKCGTSAMYQFLSKQKGVNASSANKEYCPGLTPTLYNYLKGFKTTQGVVYINSCLNMREVFQMHQLLSPKTIYIIMVRNLSDWIWAVYNFWCKSLLDEDCSTGGWTKPGMYRSPTHFHELLMIDSYPKSKKLFFTMNYLTSSYKNRIDHAKNITGKLPFVMASEALEGPDNGKHIQRLQDYINTNLNINLKLDISHLKVVNAGDHRGVATQSNHTSSGLYEISGHQPMLPATVDYINSKWKLCEYISSLAQYSYNCSTVHT